MKYQELVANHKPVEVISELEFLRPFLPWQFSNLKFIEQEKVKINVYYSEGDNKWTERVFVVTFSEKPVMICCANYRYDTPERKGGHVFDLNLYGEMLQFIESFIKIENEILENFTLHDVETDIEGLHTFFEKK